MEDIWLGPVANKIGKCFLPGCWPSSLRAPGGWRLILSLFCAQLSIPLALSESVINVCLYSSEKFVILRLVICQRRVPYLQHKLAVGTARIRHGACLGIYKSKEHLLLTPTKRCPEMRAAVVYRTLAFTHFQGTVMPSSLGYLFICVSITVLLYCHRGNRCLNFALETQLLKLLS